VTYGSKVFAGLVGSLGSEPVVVKVLPQHTVLLEVDHDRASLAVVTDDVFDAFHVRILLPLFIHEPEYMPADPAIVTDV
jgi:hypothetical protein